MQVLFIMLTRADSIDFIENVRMELSNAINSFVCRFNCFYPKNVTPKLGRVFEKLFFPSATDGETYFSLFSLTE